MSFFHDYRIMIILDTRKYQYNYSKAQNFMSSVSQLKAMWEKKAAEDKEKSINVVKNYQAKPKVNDNKTMVNQSRTNDNNKSELKQKPIFTTKAMTTNQKSESQPSPTKKQINKEQLQKNDQIVKQKQFIESIQKVESVQSNMTNSGKLNNSDQIFVMSNSQQYDENIFNDSQSSPFPSQQIAPSFSLSMKGSSELDFIRGRNRFLPNQQAIIIPKFHITQSVNISEQIPIQINQQVQQALKKFVTRNIKRTAPSFLSFDEYD